MRRNGWPHVGSGNEVRSMRETPRDNESQAAKDEARSQPDGRAAARRSRRWGGDAAVIAALIPTLAMLLSPTARATVDGSRPSREIASAGMYHRRPPTADRLQATADRPAPTSDGSGAAVPAGQRHLRVAVTIDDLPKTAGGAGIEDARRVTRGILQALQRHDVPAVGFVISARVVVRGQVDERLDLLRQWRDAGVELANHGYSHLDFQRVSLEEYQDDFIKGDLLPLMVMQEAGRPIRYFRHPFNHTGPDAESKRAFEAFAAERGYSIAPFTVEHADYIYNLLHIEAREAGDSVRVNRIRGAYLAHLDAALDFAERLSRETFGRDIPQVLLTHANDINADCLDLILERLTARGYEFVSLEAAMADPAYATPDRYVGRFGPSWLHRWRLSLGLEDRLPEEPDPPGWVLEAYRALQERR